MAAFFDRFLLRLGPFDLTARSQALVAQNAHRFDFRALPAAGAVFEDFEIAGSGFSVFIGFFDFFGLWAPKDQKFADVLNGCRAELVGQLGHHGLACQAVVAQHADFDQAMGVQGRFGFLDHRRGQAIAADHDDGTEVVGIGAKNFSLGRCELYLGHPLLSPQGRRRMKVKTKSKKVNKAWLNDHVNDTYVKLALREGYRARAAYKLKEIDESMGLIRPGDLVVDLGSAPGAWSQYLRRRLSPDGAAVGALNGSIIALDLLPMVPVEGVQFIQGDFRENEVAALLEAALKGQQVDVVVSDMAPNLSGIESSDAARVQHLVELAVEFSQNHLKPQGALVVKVFHGSGYSQIVKMFKETFKVVKPIKPKASRDKSSETFLVGVGLIQVQDPH